MKRIHGLPALIVLVGALMVVIGVAERTAAYSTFFESRCRSCHTDDTQTCDGCHYHRGYLWAEADQASYEPGAMVTVTLHGGTWGGWIRAILYDDLGQEIDRAQGPTGTGDDGLGNPVEFPVDLQAPAPLEIGEYVWSAVWYGSDNAGIDHLELGTPVTVTVEVDIGVDDDWPIQGAEAELGLLVFPNPLTVGGTLRFTAGPGAGLVTLSIVDPTGRHIRRLCDGSIGPGEREVAWDGRDEAGLPVASGSYLAVLSGTKASIVRPILILR